MEKSFKISRISSLVSHLLLLSPFVMGPAAYAATAINLSHTPEALQALSISRTVSFKETNRNVDVKQNLHIRMQQKYLGHVVRGGDFTVHTSKAGKKMTGYIYSGLDQDLKNSSAKIDETAGKIMLKKAIQLALTQYKINKTPEKIKEEKIELMVYIDKNHQAKWAFKTSFLIEPADENSIPIKPVYILDAVTGQIYAEWNDVKNLQEATLADTFGGGFGGNKKMGKLTYDGLDKNLPKLTINFDKKKKLCYWQNNDVTVKSYKTKNKISFTCKTVDPDHNDIYWIGDTDSVNGGYGPASDALFAGAVIKDMYLNWYKLPVLVNDDGSPMMLNMIVHVPNYDNAYWDGSQMTFGDGYSYFYPLTSLGVGAHEISHGFTEQHSGLEYYAQSGGMNESFSDMAAQAAEFYAYGTNSWQIGPEIFKAENEALRYMDQPSKDCGDGREPGDYCSIDDASQYPDDSLDVHYSSGVFNHLFYLMGTTPGWDTKKAFDLMVHANLHYWQSTSNFIDGACGIIHSAEDLGYDVDAVKAAIDKVKIDTSSC
jgi:pseudolysin